MQTRFLGVLLLLGALWGASFLFIKIGVQEMPPETLVAIRLSVAAVVLLGALYARGLRLPSQPRAWADMFFVGVFGTVLPYMLITWGEQHITSGMASILNATMPLFTVLLTYVWTREERLSGLRLIGVLIGFVGVIVAVGFEHLSLTAADTQGQLGVLLASLCYAITGIYARRAFRGMPALIPATGQMLTGALVIAPIALALHGIPSPVPSPLALGVVLALGIFGTAIAYILLYWLLERIGAARNSMVTYLLPPFALVYGALFLGERISIEAVLGLGLVILGILFSNGVIKLRRAPVVMRPAPAGGVCSGES